MVSGRGRVRCRRECRASAIASPAPGTCFVAVGLSDVLLTRDGGSSWSWSRTGLAPLASELTGLRFVSERDGWAWGIEAAGPGAPQAVLLHTDDGGETWQEQLRIPGDEFVDVRAFDSLSAWAVARDAERPERPVLFTTTDGGQDWDEVTPPADEDTTFAALAAAGPQSALLVETVWSTGAGSGDVVGSRMWRTSDGGAHWTPPLTLAGAEIVDVTFSSPQRGWAAGLAGSVWGTSDGGASWKRLYRSPGFLGLVAMDSIGDDVWAVGGQGSLHSFDGGVTWQTQAAVRGNIDRLLRLPRWLDRQWQHVPAHDGRRPDVESRHECSTDRVDEARRGRRRHGVGRRRRCDQIPGRRPALGCA